MKTLTKVTIENDYNSNLSYDMRNDDISYLLTELDLFCDIRNNNYINIVSELQYTTKYKDDYKNKIVVEAKGYSQSEWQYYTLYYNKDTINKKLLKQLINTLEKTFTHQNDYIATKTEVVIIDDKKFESEPIDYTGLYVSHIEFPTNDDIIKEYINQYGKDYNTIECNID